MSGTAQIFPVVGNNTTFPNPMPTQDVSDGTPGSAAPNTALQVAGSDGTDLRTIATDPSGDVKVVGPAANGAPATGNPVAIAGTDGTAVREVATDLYGVVFVQESAKSPLLIVLGQILSELRSIRAAMVTMVTEGGSCMESDFVPENLDPDLLPTA